MSEQQAGVRPRKVHLPIRIDDEDRKLFGQARWRPFHAQIEQLREKGFATTRQSLYVYGMFLEWDAVRETTYRDFSKAVPRFQKQYDEYLKIENGALTFSRPPRGDMAQRIGVAGALNISARIVGVTEADFRRIPDTSLRRTFDYDLEVSALGPAFELVVEAKGTHDGASLYKHIRSIREKKETARPKGRKVVRIGCVTDIATTDEGASSITLVDPPEEDGDAPSARERLVTRLGFYLRAIRLVTPTGRVAVALANRLNVIRRVADETALDGAPLTGADEKELPLDRLPGYPLSVRGDRRTVLARFYPVDPAWKESRGDVACYAHGLERRIVRSLIMQKHQDLLTLGMEAATLEISNVDVEGYLSVLPSGVVGGLVTVDRRLLTRNESDDDGGGSPWKPRQRQRPRRY